MSAMVYPTQSNTVTGARRINAGEALTGKEGHLVTVADAGSVAEVLLPTTIHDLCPYLVVEGGAHDTDVTVLPLDPSQQVRVRAKGTGSAGALLVLADPGTAADKGKVRAMPTTAGRWRIVGVAEEDFVDGQLVAVRPVLAHSRNTSVVALTSTDAVAGAAPDLTALKAEAEKIGDDVRAIHAALVAQGILSVT